MTRTAKIAKAKRLRAEGLSNPAIAKRLGVHSSTVSRWITMSGSTITRTCEGCGEQFEWTVKRGQLPKWCSEKCRKAQYAASCAVCGKRDNGSGGYRTEYVCRACKHETEYGERNRRIIKAWEAGIPAAEIAAEAGLDKSALLSLIDHWRKRKGVELELRRRSPMTEAERHKVIRMWNGGVPTDEIAAALGFSGRASVIESIHYMRRQGYEIPHRSPWATRKRRSPNLTKSA